MTSAFFTFVGAVIGFLFGEFRHRREMSVKMIEIALGILRDKPQPENKALREWAVKILALNSPKEAPLSAEAQRAMLDNPLPYSSVTFDAATAARTLQDLGKTWPSA
jgi:hypothetical protein